MKLYFVIFRNFVPNAVVTYVSIILSLVVVFLSNLISVITTSLVSFSQTDVFLYLLVAFAFFATIQLFRKAVYG